MLKKTAPSGFTLLEIVVVLAFIAVLAAIAIPLYHNYVVRAHVADLIVNYEEIKSTLASSYEKDGPCRDTVNTIDPVHLQNPHVALLETNYDTGINVADGQSHRVSVSWDSAAGRLAVFDNGQLVKSWDNVHTGATIPGDGRMVIAHKSTGGGAYNPSEAYAGQIFNAAIARGAVDDGDLDKPLNQVVDTGSGLLADFQVVGGSAVDTTGRHTVETGGMTPTLTGVEGNLVKQP